MSHIYKFVFEEDFSMHVLCSVGFSFITSLIITPVFFLNVFEEAFMLVFLFSNLLYWAFILSFRVFKKRENKNEHVVLEEIEHDISFIDTFIKDCGKKHVTSYLLLSKIKQSCEYIIESYTHLSLEQQHQFDVLLCRDTYHLLENYKQLSLLEKRNHEQMFMDSLRIIHDRLLNQWVIPIDTDKKQSFERTVYLIHKE